MTKIVYCCSIALLTGCMIINARTAHTGHLIVSLTDRETGEPITNAMVKVRVQTKRSIGGHSAPQSSFAISDSKADSHGVANVEFKFYYSDFDWWVRSPTHYCHRYSNDKVVEQLFPNGQNTTGVDIKSLGARLNMQNVFGCCLSPHVRKVRHGILFPTYTSSVDDYANMYNGLYARLLRYKAMKPSCIIKIRIYEGENAQEANETCAETENVLNQWPLIDEENYK